MSLTIATESRRFTMKADEEQSEKMFNDIMAGILELGGAKLPAKRMKRSVPGKAEESKELPADTTVEDESEDLKDSVTDQKGYTGFLHIKCPECGVVKSFCAKYPLTYFICNACGEKTDLKDLTKIYMNCECGKNTRYLTNQKEFAFDVDCIECGSPVAVKYNSKKNIYETIRD